MRRLVISVLCGIGVAATSVITALAQPNVTGTWSVQQTGVNGTTQSTITLKQSGNSFVGHRASDGTGFTGTFVNDTPVNGKWHGPGGAGWLTIYVSPGGPTAFVGSMRCTQSGPTVVCHAGGITLEGKFRTKDKVRATWTGPNGSGWFSFWFNDDNNSFNGIWGNGAETTQPVGRVVGQRALK